MAWIRDKLPKQDIVRKAHNLIVQTGPEAQRRANNLAGTVSFEFMHRLKTFLEGVTAELSNLKTLAPAGTAAYAKDQYGDPTFEVIDEFNAVQAAVDAALVEMNAVAVSNLGDDFTPAQTASVKTALETVATATGL